MGTPFFSVIIPCFNSASYMDDTLASLAKQSYESFEVIVVDDGSVDNSLDVCLEAFKKYKLKGQIVRRSANHMKGVASCRNIGVELASYEWLCFLDSDDLFAAEKLVETARAIDQYKSECDAYYHACYKFDDGQKIDIPKANDSDIEICGDISAVLQTQNNIVTSTVTINKKLFDACNGFDLTLNGVEDYFMWLKIAKKTKWHYTDKALGYYRVRPVSLMNGRKLVYYVQQIAALNKALRSSTEFSRDEIAKVCQYNHETLDYYVMTTLKIFGWRDCIKGLAKMATTTLWKSSFILFCKYSWQLILRKLSILASVIRKK